MADSQVDPPKRIGNYVPERIRILEKEISEKYAAGQSARSLAKEYAMSKAEIQGAVRRQGVSVRGKFDAGSLLRTRKPSGLDLISALS